MEDESDLARNSAPDDMYAGLTDLPLNQEEIQFSMGVTLQRAHAVFTTPLALKNTGPHHGLDGFAFPALWQFSKGNIEIIAEVHVSASYFPKFEDQIEVVKFSVALLRLWCNPEISMPVISTLSMSRQVSHAIAKSTPGAYVRPMEVWQKRHGLRLVDKSKMADSVEWVRIHWDSAYQLYRESAEFRIAIDALDSGQFIPNVGLSLVSMWGALEALFSPSTSELRFRVSALIAAYMEMPGALRHERQRTILKMYDKRSAAAHGKPTQSSDDLAQVLTLLREVVIKIIHEGRVPSKSELEARLFGV